MGNLDGCGGLPCMQWVFSVVVWFHDTCGMRWIFSAVLSYCDACG